jgi:hypothetical protein
VIHTHSITASTAPAIDFLLGDLLIAFHTGAEHFPARHATAGWQRAAEGASWQVWQQPGGPDWHGMPATSFAADGWQGWLLGELYGTADKLQPLRDVVEGRIGASNLNGHFLLIAHEKATDRWHVWTNRLGTLHAYYAFDGRRAALGTFFPAVAAVASQCEMDWNALTGFFGMGFFSGEQTYYSDVRVLRPATHYIFSAEGALLAQKRYWEWNYMPNKRRSYQDTIDEFAGLIQTVLRELTADGRVALPISGGLDSRTTVAALACSRNDSPPSNLWAYSYGYGKNSVETRIARQVAAARHLPFHSFAIQPYLFERLPLVMACLEGFQDVTQARQASIIRELDQHAEVVIAAHWGDVWFDDMGLADDGTNRATHHRTDYDPLHAHALKKMVKGGRQWLLDNVCQAQIGDQYPATILDQLIEASLAEVSHIAEPDFRVKTMKAEQWSARWTTASLRMFQAVVFPRLPFYDTRMIDFFCTVPTSYVRGRQMQIDYLKHYAPDLARIIWQVHDANLYRNQQLDILQLPKRTMKKAWRLLARQPVIERNWEVQFSGENGRRGLHHWLLRPGLRLHEFASPQALANLLAAFYAEPLAEKRGYTVSMLLTFSAWLEQYG